MSEYLDVAKILAGGDDYDVPEGHRSGIVALVGRPNVGKSTLVNALVGEKVAIVTDVPGTTRNAIRAVVTREDSQVVFVDTPGVAKPRTLLTRRLNTLVHDTWSGVDVILFLVDGHSGIGTGDQFLATQLASVKRTPIVCVVTKEDLVHNKQKMLKILLDAQNLGEFAEIVPTAAPTGANVEHLLDVLVGYLPEGPRLFPDGTVSDQTEEHLVSELIREKFISRMGEEVPHSIAVVVNEMGVAEHREDLIEIVATIYVERDSQKGIVIGKGGIVIKEAGTQARVELEQHLGTKVHLDLKVKIAKEWQKDPKRLARFGY